MEFETSQRAIKPKGEGVAGVAFELWQCQPVYGYNGNL
jgi:hypothetical protein